MAEPPPARGLEGVFCEGEPSVVGPRRRALERLRGHVRRADLSRGDLRRAARGARRRRPRDHARRGHRGLRGRLQVTAACSRSSAPTGSSTPRSARILIGGAVGAAIAGMQPVCEMQFVDFVACAFDQLVNVAGSRTATPGSGPHRRARALRGRGARGPLSLAEPRGLVHPRRGSRSSAPARTTRRA